jgi:Mrp family chromosome partitioning ATPase
VDPARAAQTQADFARTQEVVGAALRSAHVRGLTPDVLLARSSVVASLGSDFLTFSVKDANAAIADRLATTYARSYVAYRYRMDTQAIAHARHIAQRQLAHLEAAGLTRSAAHKGVEAQLASLDGTAVPALVVLHTADGAVQIGPRLKRNVGMALVLGLFLGIGLAFVWDLFDTRVRSLDALQAALPQLSVLGRLPVPARALRDQDDLVMSKAPTSAEAEPIRVLRANFEFAAGEVRAKTIMFTSGVGGEGKSTTAANLALALARGGRRVVLVDFDMRNPSAHRFFGVKDTPGVIDVALYDADVEDALAQVQLVESDRDRRASRSATAETGRLEILPLGRTLQDPDQLRADVVVRQVLERIRRRADYILIDAGPLLPTGDAIALSAHVDAMVLIVRLNVLPVSALDDLAHVLNSSRAAKLGLVVTGAETLKQQSSRYASPRRSGDVNEPAASAHGNGAVPGTNGALAPGDAEPRPSQHGGARRRPVGSA